jgi:hypothetical protein
MRTEQGIPNTQTFFFGEPFHTGGNVEFRLVYRGMLPAASESDTRALAKHRIRQKLHPQLRELWHQHPTLKATLEGQTGGRSNVELVADRFVRGVNGNYRFVPLIREEHYHFCSLNVLFLRRDSPGNLVKSGGDLDNRVKVLFDALTVPGDNATAGLKGEPEPEERPFFCLLQDDKLITEVSITTDRLLHPIEQDERLGDVHLVIHVKTAPVDYRGAFNLY